MTKLTTLLVDADQIFYQHTSAHQYEQSIDHTGDHWLFEGDTYLITDVAAARLAITRNLENLSYGYDDVILCFTSTPNFRHSVYSPYKGGRLKKRKPVGYWDLIVDFEQSPRWQTKKIPGLEADDVMSILATHPKHLATSDMYIYSQDKDMLQVPVTPIFRGGVTAMSTDAEANHFRWTQTLTGDATDGYPGLKGYGPKKADAYLDEFIGQPEDVYESAVVSAYLDAGFTAEYAYSQINCALILRAHEYDFKNKQPKLRGMKDAETDTKKN